MGVNFLSIAIHVEIVYMSNNVQIVKTVLGVFD